MRNVSPLNALACERLRNGSLGDPTHPSLRIMVRPKSGRKLWVYRYRDPSGRMAQLRIGSYPALSLADARTEWRNAKAVRDRHGDPRDTAKLKKAAAAKHAERSRGYTVAQAARDYRSEYLENLARGHEQYRILERDILPKIGGVVLQDLKTSAVLSAIAPIPKTGAACGGDGTIRCAWPMATRSGK